MVWKIGEEKRTKKVLHNKFYQHFNCTNANSLHKILHDHHAPSKLIDNNQLKFIGDMIIDFKDMEDFYSHFQIKRNYRKNIDRINSSFVFNFDDKLFELNELKIKGIDKQILVKFLNSFNSKEKDFFNKVTIRNTVRDFFRIISSG